MRKPSKSPIAEAYFWVSQVITICMEMLLPIYLGSKLDEYWESKPACTLAGAALGMVVSISHLLQMTREPPNDPPNSRTPPPPPTP